MVTSERTYRISAAGVRALASERSVPAWYRAILGLLQGEVASSRIVGAMGTHSRKEVLAWLEQLETLGFVEVADPSAPPAEASVDFGFDVVLAQVRAVG